MRNRSNGNGSSGFIFAGQSLVGADLDRAIVARHPTANGNEIVLHEDDFVRKIIFGQIYRSASGSQVESEAEDLAGRCNGRDESAVFVVIVNVGHVLVVKLAPQQAGCVVVSERGRVLVWRLESLEIADPGHAQVVLEAVRSLKSIYLTPVIRI